MTFIRHKDLATKKIDSIEDKGSELLVRQKDKRNIQGYLTEKIDASLLKKADSDDTKMVFCPNTEENLKFLVKNWKKFIKIKNLTMIFVNLEINDKWIINPKFHSMIADPSTIGQGLRSMFDTANGKVDSGLSKKRKPKIFDDDVADEEDEEK